MAHGPAEWPVETLENKIKTFSLSLSDFSFSSPPHPHATVAFFSPNLIEIVVLFSLFHRSATFFCAGKKKNNPVRNGDGIHPPVPECVMQGECPLSVSCACQCGRYADVTDQTGGRDVYRWIPARTCQNPPLAHPTNENGPTRFHFHEK